MDAFAILSRGDLWVLLFVGMGVLLVASVLACMPAAARPRPVMPDDEVERSDW